MPNNYEEYYDVRLFNDIHNYFPELLYGDLNQFPTTRSLLEYVRNQIRNHYDIFSAAQRNYRQNNNVRVSFNIQDIADTSDSEPEANDPLTTLLASSLLSLANIPVTSFSTTPVSLTRMPTLTRQRNFMEPVVVRPTQQQIDNGSSIVENLSTSENCAICQDTMEGVHRIRRLNHCSHMFHDNCISTWFRRNVHCPTCRHDIRN